VRFDSRHPAVNFIFFSAVILADCLFNQPVFLAIGWVCPFVYSLHLAGKRAMKFDGILLIFTAIFPFLYSFFAHFGVTVLTVNVIGNPVTLEAIVSGLVIAVKVSSFLMWFFCVHEVVSSDQIVYLFGRISPRLSLFLSILLRMVPQIRLCFRRVNEAQKGIGLGVGEGGFLRGISRWFRVSSIVLTWLNDSLIQSAASMKCRGYSLPGRTAFSVFRFDYRDRIFVISMSACLSVLTAGSLLDQTRILYRPEIVMNHVTPVSFLFYAAYGILCLMPLAADVISSVQFRKAEEISAV
jgi:energy-coupling factor transport system permease protein